MKKRISHISLHQTAWTVALWSFLVAMVAWVIWSIVHLAMGQWNMVLWGLLGVVVYGAFTYIYWIISALIYNWAACWTGGIEVKFKDCGSCASEEKQA